MEQEEHLHKNLTKPSLKFDQEVKNDLRDISESIDEINLERIVEDLLIAFREDIKGDEEAEAYWEKYGVSKENYKNQYDYEALGWRYFTIRDLVNGEKTVTTLDDREKNSFASPNILSVNIAWCGLLQKLVEDYEKEDHNEFLDNFFVKSACTPKKGRYIHVRIEWSCEEVKEALEQYKKYIIATAKFILKYKLAVNEDSQKALAKFIKEMTEELITALKTKENTEIIVEAYAELLTRFPDVTEKSKANFKKVPSLMSTIFKAVLFEDDTIPHIRLQNKLTSLTDILNKPNIELFNEATKVVEELTQAMDRFKALCNTKERNSFIRNIEKPINTILDKFKILSSCKHVLTEMKNLNSNEKFNINGIKDDEEEIKADEPLAKKPKTDRSLSL